MESQESRGASPTALRLKKVSTAVQASSAFAMSSTPTPKPTSTWGTAGRFDYPGKSWTTQMAKADERLESLLAEPAEKGAQVVVEPTRCACTLGVTSAYVCAATLPAGHLTTGARPGGGGVHTLRSTRRVYRSVAPIRA